MKLVRDPKELKAQHPDILVLTGNGKTEARILSSLCEKYNGKTKFLLFPEAPIRRGLKETGFEGLRAVSVCLTEYELGRFLFLIDRKPKFEKVKRGEEHEEIDRYLKKELKAKIKATYIHVPRKAFLSKGCLGCRPFDIYTVVLGVTSNVEEEISELIRLKFGTQVNPDKAEIRKFLKRRGKDLDSLVGEASKRYLEKAFPGLCNVLKRIEEN